MPSPSRQELKGAGTYCQIVLMGQICLLARRVNAGRLLGGHFNLQDRRAPAAAGRLQLANSRHHKPPKAHQTNFPLFPFSARERLIGGPIYLIE